MNFTEQVDQILQDMPDLLTGVKQQGAEALSRLTASNVSDARREEFLLGLMLTAYDLWREVVDLSDVRQKATKAKASAETVVMDATHQANCIIAAAEKRAASDEFVRKARAEADRYKQEWQAKHDALLQPHAEAIVVFQELLKQAGYVPQKTWEGDMRMEPVPSPVLCWIGAIVMAQCGKNPVTIQNGQSVVSST